MKFYFSWWNAYPAHWILISICEWKIHGWHRNRWRWAWWTWERKSTFVVAWVCRCWEWWRTCASPCEKGIERDRKGRSELGEFWTAVFFFSGLWITAYVCILVSIPFCGRPVVAAGSVIFQESSMKLSLLSSCEIRQVFGYDFLTRRLYPNHCYIWSLCEFSWPAGKRACVGVLVCLVQVPPFLPTRQSRHFKKYHRNTISGEFSLRSGYCCPSCGHTERIFSPSTGGAQAMCQQMDVPYLGSVPLDGRVAAAGDQGMPLAQLQPDGPVAKCSWA